MKASNPFNDGRREGDRRKQAAFDLLEAHRKRLVTQARRELLMHGDLLHLSIEEPHQPGVPA